MVLFLGIGPPFVNLGVCPLVSTWIYIWRERRHSCQRLSFPAYFTSRGRARWVGGRRWRLSRRRQSSKRVSFYFPFVSFWLTKLYSFSQSMVSYCCTLLGMLVAEWEPTPCYRDAYSVGTPKWAYWRKGWQKHYKTTFSPFCGRFFLVSESSIFFFLCYCMDVSYWEGQASWAWPPFFSPRSAVY